MQKGFYVVIPIPMATVIPPKPENNRFHIPDSFRKGDEFQDFVINTLFPPALYTVVNRSPGYLRNAENSKGNTSYPVLTLRDHSNGFEFNIECRHRHALIANNFRFAGNLPFNIRQELPVFLILGLGGEAGKPTDVFLTNFKDCPPVSLFKRHLKNKSIPVNNAVLSARLWTHEPLSQLVKKEIA
ncbi:MAG: hypothetical protein ACTHLE_21930 [Agriterribacter sp.]